MAWEKVMVDSDLILDFLQIDLKPKIIVESKIMQNDK